MALSSPGIGSNLDVNSIVKQLMSVEQQPLVALARKEASYQAKLSAIGNLKGALGSFQSAVQGLSNVSNFQTIKGSVSDTTIASVSATGSASPGTYSLEVTKLAQAQKLVTTGQASTTTAIGTGTITIDVGKITGGTFDGATGKYTGATFTSNGNGTKTITIDSSNNSLAGIRDAINKADIGVTAAIVNDGGTSPYRLVLTQTTTGASNSLKISVTGDAALQGLIAHDPSVDGGQALSETVTAQNAEFKLDGISISKSSNTVTDAIPGATLTLAKTNAGSPTSITLSRDGAQVTSAVQKFVKAFNDINLTLRNLSAYDAEKKQAAILNGDATVRNIQTQLRSVLTTPVSDSGTAYSVLSQIGVTLQKDGSLAIDNAKLKSAIDADNGDIASLFAATGRATDSLVTSLGGGDKTAAGSYALSVTQMASQGKTTGNAAASLTVDPTNDLLDVKLDGITTTIALTQKTYASAAELAAEIQAKINGATEFSDGGIQATVTESAGVLTLTSNSFGSVSTASITGGTGKTSLFGASPTTTDGVDVAGTINGVAAIGSGQVLTGAIGDKSEGLRLEITGGATGNRGTVSFSRGYADQFDRLLDSILGTEGSITARTDGLNASLKSLETQMERLNERLEGVEKRYRAQFLALDQAISSMTTTSNYLSQQLAGLSSNNQ